MGPLFIPLADRQYVNEHWCLHITCVNIQKYIRIICDSDSHQLTVQPHLGEFWKGGLIGVHIKKERENERERERSLHVALNRTNFDILPNATVVNQIKTGRKKPNNNYMQHFMFECRKYAFYVQRGKLLGFQITKWIASFYGIV